MRFAIFLAMFLGMSLAVVQAIRDSRISNMPASGAILPNSGMAHDITIATGRFDDNPESVEQAYFLLGDTTLVAVRPGSVSHDLLKQVTRDDRKGVLVFRVIE